MDQLSLFAPNAPAWQDVLNGKLLWDPSFLTPGEANVLLNQLMSNVPWKQESITLFGKSVKQPRLQTWYGDKGYHYSGLTLPPTPWLPALLPIKQACEVIAEQEFNSVLINLYRDGQDSMGWHQDNETELGKNPVIASLSLGESRRFLLRHLHCKSKLEYELNSGSLLIMGGELQHFWQHCVPKTARPKEPRINLTFRYVKG